MRKSFRNKKAYTLAELLAVVAIIVILIAVALPNIFEVQKKLRQAELDAKAETIYVAVQNRLSKMKAADNTDALAKGEKVESQPSDYSEEKSFAEGDLLYFTSGDAGKTVAQAVISGDTIDATLAGNHWVVEYNPSNYTVYAVFYSEEREDAAALYPYGYDARVKDNRLSNGAKVGYYGGSAGGSGANLAEINPSIEIINDEKLTAIITCTMPESVKDYSPVFKVEISDNAGNTNTAYYAWSGDEAVLPTGTNMTLVEQSAAGRTYTLNLTLDDLTSTATRFVTQYGKNPNNASDQTDTTKLLCGTEITIKVTAMCPGNKTVSGNHFDTAKTNSLFDYDPDAADTTALIRYGRHLQNLDSSSGVSASVTKAEQVADIVFTDQADKTKTKDWYETYHTAYFNGNETATATNPFFKPINNSTLKSYEAAKKDDSGNIIKDSNGDILRYTIENLNVNTSLDHSGVVNAGLFEILGEKQAQTVQYLYLKNAKVIADANSNVSAPTAPFTRNAGALAGKITGGSTAYYITVEGAAVSSVSGTGSSASSITNAGGLAGEISGTQNVHNIFLTDPAVFSTSSVGAVSSFFTNAGGLAGKIYGTSKVATVTIMRANVSSASGIQDDSLFITNAGGFAGEICGASTAQDIDMYYPEVSAANHTNKDLPLANAGGLAGNIYGASIIQGINVAAPTVSASKDSGFLSYTYAGGLAGEISGGSRVEGSNTDDEHAYVIVTGAKVTSNDDAGGLAGEVYGSASLTDCRVYLTTDDIGTGETKKSNSYVWISGDTAGGLIGAVSSDLTANAEGTVDTVTVNNCSASTVVGTSTSDTLYAGGMIAYVTGYENDNIKVNITDSYADNYLVGATAGGLVGYNDPAYTTLNIDSCYAAGFMTFTDKTNSAGLVNTATMITDTYNIMLGLNLDSASGTALETTTSKCTNMTRVYYMPSEEDIESLMPAEAEKKSPNNHFISAPTDDDTKPVLYNLLNQGLETYDYPVIDGVRHYGDYAYTLTLDPKLTDKTAVWSWSSYLPGTVSDITTVLEYTAPTQTGMKLLGWYTSDELNDDGTPKGTRILVPVENNTKALTIEAAAGSYLDGALVVSENNGTKAMTLTSNVTLYAIWEIEGYKLTLQAGTGTTTGYWSAAIPDKDKISDITTIVAAKTITGKVYETPTVEGWTLCGWYTTTELNSDGTPKGTMILDASGKVISDSTKAGYNYTGYTENGVLKLTENKTLYACWTQKTDTTIYVLVDSFSYEGQSAELPSSVDLTKVNEYIIASGTSNTVSAFYDNNGAVATTSIAVTNKTIADGGLSDRPYIEKTALAGLSWNQLVWQAIPSRYLLSTISGLPDYSGNNKDGDGKYELAFHLKNLSTSNYVNFNTTDWAEGGGYLEISSSLLNNTSSKGNDWSFETRMWKYGGTYNEGTKTVDNNALSEYFSTTPWGTYFDFGPECRRDNTVGNAYIYQKQSINTTVYTFDFCTVTYDSNGGGTMDPSSLIVKSGSQITLADAPTAPEGKKLQCWTADDDAHTAYAPGDVTVITKNTKFTATWVGAEYTIEYYRNEETDAVEGYVAPQKATVGVYPTLSTNEGGFTWTGHTLLGWDTDKNATTPAYALGATLTTDLTTTDGATVTLYAVWKVNQYSYTVKYVDEDTGNEIATATTASADYDTVITAANYKQSITGYAQTTTSGDLTVTTDVSANVITIYYSKDENGPEGKSDNVPDKKEHELIYKANGGTGTMTDSNIYPSGYVKQLADNEFVKDGYIWDYWSLNGTAVTSVTFADSDITVQAEWRSGLSISKAAKPTSVSAGGKVTYTITVTNITAQDVTGITVNDCLDSRLTLDDDATKQVNPVYNDYQVKDHTVTWSSVSVLANGTTTLYLIVTVPSNVTEPTTIENTATLSKGSYTASSETVSITVNPKYTVTYDAKGGKVTPKTSIKEYDVDLPLNIKPTYDGYVFMGWDTDSAATNVVYKPGDAYKDNADITLYAVWSNGLFVEKTADKTTVYAGENVVYTITVSNNTSEAVSDLTVTDILPSGLTFVSADAGYKKDQNTWTISSLAAKGKETLTLTAEADAVNEPKNVTNTATLKSANVVKSTASATVTVLPVYTVSYDAKGGTGAPDPQQKKYNEDLTLSTTVPTRSGYKFLGWSTKENPTGEGDVNYSAGGTYPANDNLKLYAVWKQMYRLILKNGVSSAVEYLSNYIPNTGASSITGYTAPSVKGWTLSGWYAWDDTYDKTGTGTTTCKKVLNADGTLVSSESGTGFTITNGTITLSQDVTIYACWTQKGTEETTTIYVLTNSFTDGGKYIIANTNTAGSATALSNSSGTVSAKTGFTVETGDLASAPYIQTDDASVVWNAIEFNNESRNNKKYNGFRLKNGDWYLNNYCEYGSNSSGTGVVNKAVTSIESDSPDKVGGYSYEFRMWQYNNGLIPCYGHDTGCYTQNAYFAANGSVYTTVNGKDTATRASGGGTIYIYEEQTIETGTPDQYTYDIHTVTFDANGHGTAPSAQFVADGKTAENPGSPTGNTVGYTFGGWDYVFSTPVTSDITLYAKWTPKEYTVTIEGVTHGSASASKSPAYMDDSITITVTPEEGYELDTITVTDKDGKNVELAANNTFTMPASDVKVAVTFKAKNYNVRVEDTTNGTAKADKSTAKTDETVTIKDITPDTCYVVDAVTVTKTSDGSTVAVTKKADGTYTFTMPASDVTVSVTFKGETYPISYYDGNTQISGLTPNSYSYGTGIAEGSLPSQTKTGYTFNGWYDAKTGGSEVRSIAANNTGEVKLYARWTANTYTVEFNANGGTGTMDSESFTYDEEKALTANAFTKAGYTFNGWKDANGNTYTDGESVKNLTAEPNGIVTLTAQWTPNTLTLVGSTSSTTYNIPDVLDKTSLTITTPTYDGWTFDGWSTSRGGAIVIDTNGKMVADISGYTNSNGEWTRTESTTLYARWTRTGYVQTTSDGTNYLIGSAPSNNRIELIYGTATNTNLSYGDKTVTGSGSYVIDLSNTNTKANVIFIDEVVGDNYNNYKWNLSSGVITSVKYSQRIGRAVVDPLHTYAKLNGTEELTFTINSSTITTKIRGVGVYLGSDRVYHMSKTHCYLYKEVTAYAWSETYTTQAGSEAIRVNSPLATGLATDSSSSALMSAPLTAANTTNTLTLQNGTSVYMTATPEEGIIQLTDYTAPTRQDSSWTLDGWYTAYDGTGIKILNADGTIAEADAEGYTSEGTFALAADAVLYARWSRETSVYLQTDTLEDGETYLYTMQLFEDDPKLQMAIGQQTEENVYAELIDATDPAEGSGEYSLYDAETGTLSSITGLYIASDDLESPEKLEWYCEGGALTAADENQNQQTPEENLQQLGEEYCSTCLFKRASAVQISFNAELTPESGETEAVSVAAETEPEVTSTETPEEATPTETPEEAASTETPEVDTTPAVTSEEAASTETPEEETTSTETPEEVTPAPLSLSDTEEIAEDEETAESLPVEEESYENPDGINTLTLMNGTSVYMTNNPGDAAVQLSDYSAPTRKDSSWTLDGWYTTVDKTERKVLNADGTVNAETAGTYARFTITSDETQGTLLTLTNDLTLHARWSHPTSVYVRTDTLKDGETYLTTMQLFEDDPSFQLAIGQRTEKDEAYSEFADAIDPEKSSEYSLYDEETGAITSIPEMYIASNLLENSEALEWYCENGTLINPGAKQTASEDNQNLPTPSDNLQQLIEKSNGEIEDSGIHCFYRRMTAVQTTFADEIVAEDEEDSEEATSKETAKEAEQNAASTETSTADATPTATPAQETASSEASAATPTQELTSVETSEQKTASEETPTETQEESTEQTNS